jgi:hypothetical protein
MTRLLTGPATIRLSTNPAMARFLTSPTTVRFLISPATKLLFTSPGVHAWGSVGESCLSFFPSGPLHGARTANTAAITPEGAERKKRILCGPSFPGVNAWASEKARTGTASEKAPTASLSARQAAQQSGKLLGRALRLAIVCIVSMLGVASIAHAEEPTKKNKPADTRTLSPKDFAGLGFSIDPKQGGKGRTSVFGLVGEGYKFAYVFDRSGSMGGEGRESLRAVKAELLKSLEHLDTVHQFQIVFYNERPVVFNPTGTAGRLAFATDENKRLAARFLDSINADGGTDHEQALRTAVNLRPDVIFFLTDADDPKLTAAQLAKIRNLAAGIIINCVEFGPGDKPSGTTFLETLAKQNGGAYVYIDISKYKIEK